MPPAVFLPCILHCLPFIQLMNTSGSAHPVLWLLWGSSKTKPNEETLNEHLILGCKHNMIRPPGFQLCLLEKSKSLPCCLQAAEGELPLFTHLQYSCVLLPAAWLWHRGCPSRHHGRSMPAGNHSVMGLPGCMHRKPILLFRMGFYLNLLLNLVFLKTGYVTQIKNCLK